MSDPFEDSDEIHPPEDGRSEGEEEDEADQRARCDDSDASQSDADDADSDAEPRFMSNRLLDLEAEEDDESDDSDEESDEESDGSGSRGSMDGFINRLESEEPRELHFFPQFKHLPLEIRLRIWEFFCPDLLADGRVYSFHKTARSEAYYHLTPGPHLSELTAAARTVLAVHQQSRDFALRAFPDTFPFLGGVIPFNKEKDVILLSSGYMRKSSDMTLSEPCLDPVSAREIRNVAFEGNSDNWYEGDWDAAVGDFFWDVATLHHCTDLDNLKNVYFVIDSQFWGTSKIFSWCASKTHHQYRAETVEVEPGLGEDLEYIYAWPNLENYPDFIQEWKTALAKHGKGYEWIDSVDTRELESIQPHQEYIIDTFKSIIRPMIEFSSDSGSRRFEKLVRLVDSGTLDDYVTSDEEESEDDDEPDEYESEGIDDSDIEEVEEHSQDEDDLIVIGDDSDDQDSDGGASTFGGFSPIQQSNANTPSRDHASGGTIDLTHDDDGAQFSSPEPQDDDESQTIRGSDSDEGPESRPRAGGKRSRGRVVESDEDEVVELEEEDEPPRRQKRKRVLDSDDEEEDVEIDVEDAAPRKRSRTANSSTGGRRNRTPIVISGDDSEEEIRERRDNQRRSRAIIIDDDDDEDEEEGPIGRGDASGSDEESESEDVEEEESRPLSLMERLELYRRDNPTPGISGDNDEGNEEEDPDIEEMGEDDYDARNYNHFEDDDERMEPSTDDDLGEGGQIDFDSDGEGDGDGGYY